MKRHKFTLILAGLAELTPEVANALYAATEGDIELNLCDGIASLEFDHKVAFVARGHHLGHPRRRRGGSGRSRRACGIGGREHNRPNQRVSPGPRGGGIGDPDNGLRVGRPFLRGVVQTRDQLSRAHALSIPVQNGSFRLHGRNASHVHAAQQELFDELTTFPFGEHDDLLDAAATGAAYLLDRPEPRVW